MRRKKRRRRLPKEPDSPLFRFAKKYGLTVEHLQVPPDDFMGKCFRAQTTFRVYIRRGKRRQHVFTQTCPVEKYDNVRLPTVASAISSIGRFAKEAAPFKASKDYMRAFSKKGVSAESACAMGHVFKSLKTDERILAKLLNEKERRELYRLIKGGLSGK